MNIIFARHGESTANTLRIFSNHHANHPLTEKGKLQAMALANHLVNRKFPGFYSSPIPRAIETAQIISEKICVPYKLHEGLREFDAGILEGRSDEKAWAEFSELWKAWFKEGLENTKIEGGESLIEIRTRLESFLLEMLSEYKDTNDNILCITHGGLLYAAIPGIVTNIPYSFIGEHLLENTDCVIIHWDGNTWKCTRWAGIDLTD